MPYSGAYFAEQSHEAAKNALRQLSDAIRKLGLDRKIDYLFGDLAPTPDDRFPENPAEVAVAAYFRDALATVQGDAAEKVKKYLDVTSHEVVHSN